MVITGKDDIVADEKETYIVRNGHEMMSHVVGTGCMAASVIGTFAGASPHDITAAVLQRRHAEGFSHSRPGYPAGILGYGAGLAVEAGVPCGPAWP